ncbi:MAG: DUF6404 family protein [Gemmobacter sp.]
MSGDALYEARLRAAMAELMRAGLARSGAAPLMLRLLRAAGVRARPPHYNSFAVNALVMGGLFALLWGGVMWFADPRLREVPADLQIMLAFSAGVVFGFLMAGYYLYGQRRHRLTPWEKLAMPAD